MVQRLQSGASARLIPPMGWNSWDSGIPLTEQTVDADDDAMVALRYARRGLPVCKPRRRVGRAHPRSRWQVALPTRPNSPTGSPAVASLRPRPRDAARASTPARSTRHAARICGLLAAATRPSMRAPSPDWGVDYLKYDWCRSDADHAEQVQAFTAMRNALRASGSPHSSTASIPNSSDDRPCRREVRLVGHCRHGTNHRRPGPRVAECAPSAR